MTDDTSPSPDYPAAHSMDTTWFAVDRDGYVAVFESNEGGAVPEAAFTDESSDALSRLQEVADTEAIYTFESDLTPLSGPDPHLKPWPVRKAQTRAAAPQSFLGRLLQTLAGKAPPPTPTAIPQPAEAEQLTINGPLGVIARDPASVQQFLERGLCRPLRSADSCAAVFAEMNIELYRELHDQGVCQACFWAFRFDSQSRYAEKNPSEYGLYHYECCEGQAAYPYGRVSVPSAPMHIDNLPQDLRDGLLQVQFLAMSFADTPYIQPPEHAKSYSWDGGYLATDWKHYRPIPGLEDQYRDLYHEMADYEDPSGIVYEPPSEPPTPPRA